MENFLKSVASALFLTLSVGIGPLLGQNNATLKALKYIEKGKIDNAIKYLEKSIEKDSINPEYYYSYSQIYLIDTLSFYNIDTSYQYINIAFQQFNSIADAKTISHLEKDGIDSTSLSAQKKRIEERAYLKAEIKNSEDTYNHFLSNYETNNWTEKAIQLRNKAAFKIALTQNTYNSYKRFMETYPNAAEVGEARIRFERLYFDESTKDKKLSSYVNFLDDYPKSQYRNLAEMKILELLTLTGQTSDFIEFINKYPKSIYRKLALNYLYHLDRKRFPEKWLTDSLIQLHKLNDFSLFPIYKFGLYGFVSNDGTEIIPPQFRTIDNSYLCETVVTNYLLAGDEIVNKLGVAIWTKGYIKVTDLGSGLLWLSHKNNSIILHKSGKKIIESNFSEAKLIGNRFIALKFDKEWTLYSLLGRKLLEQKVENIRQLGDFILLQKDDKYAVISDEQIHLLQENKPIHFEYVYLVVDLFHEKKLYVKSEKFCNVLDENLAPLLPDNTQAIEKIGNKVITQSNYQYKLYNSSCKLQSEEPFLDFMYNQSAFFTKNKLGWSKLQTGIYYDSIIILSDKMSLGLSYDSITFFSEGHQLKKSSESVFRIIKDNGYNKKKEEFLVFTNVEGIEVYNLNLELVYSGKAEKINALGPHFLVIQESGKKGVIDFAGKNIIPFKMDAIANYKNEAFSILQKSKFGMYITTNSSYVPPTYDRALKAYCENILIGFKDDNYGLINAVSNKPITTFDFEEIKYWNDTSALIKNNYEWKIIDIATGSTLIEGIKHLENISQNDNETITKVLIDNYYGILSNINGTIVPASYNDVLIIGTENTVIYLAERNIEEANFYVTIYYNGQGEIIYKQAYEEADYQKIICDLE